MTNYRLLFQSLIWLAFCSCCFGGETDWGYRYTGTQYLNTISSIVHLANGDSVFVAGGTLARIEKTGDIVWQHQVSEALSRIVPAGDGATLAATSTSNPSVFLFDAYGKLLWQRQYLLEGKLRLFQMLKFSNGCLLAFQEYDAIIPSARNMILLRINHSGEWMWGKRYKGLNPGSIAKTGDGGMIVLGRPNVTIMKLSAAGNVQWEQRFGQGSESPAEIVSLPKQFLILTSHLVKNSGETRGGIALRAFSKDGDFLWQKGYSVRREIIPLAVEVLTDRILIGGYREASGGNRDAFLMETDLEGNLRRIATYGNRHHQALTHLKWANGNVIAAVWDSPASVPGPKERNWILKFPDDQLGPSSCGGIRAANTPAAMFELPSLNLRQSRTVKENISAQVITTNETSLPGSLLKTSLCGAE